MRRLLQPGDAGDADIIEKAARTFEHRRQARGVGGRGGEHQDAAERVVRPLFVEQGHDRRRPAIDGLNRRRHRDGLLNRLFNRGCLDQSHA